MHAASIPDELGGISYCPTCSESLSPAFSRDPFAICLACHMGHRFFVMPQPAGREAENAAFASFPSLQNQSLDQVASFWLTDPRARSILNEQLAMLLRVFLEGNARVDPLRFAFCPVCRGELSDVGNDVWVQGRDCPSGHRWGERGGHLGCPVRGKFPFALCAEPSRSVVQQLISGWLNDGRHTRSYMHSSVRGVLEGFVFHGSRA
jgi:hypothetical protein